MIFKRKGGDNNLLEAAGNQQHDTTRILALVADDYLKDRKSKRRWGVIIKLAIAAYILFILFSAMRSYSPVTINEPHVAVVRLEGVIGQDPLSTAPMLNKALREAFAAKESKAVVLKINSPGGTPVQSDEVNREITRLRSVYPDKKIYGVVGDLCASGGYYIAAATDEIYANPASIVGSIGVRMGGFGFVDTMKKVGVERRLITAGESKGMLDPFSPANEEEVTHAEKMLSEVHQQFIDAVKRGRGDRLSQDSSLFTGLFWSGEEAKRLGLIDDFGDVRHVAREKLSLDKLVDYTQRTPWLESIGRRLGASISAGFSQQIWSKMTENTRYQLQAM